MPVKSVLFICAHNAARSQMAEGYLRERWRDRYEVFSAGIRSSTVSRHAITTMKEIGIDISSQQSKPIGKWLEKKMDYVVLMCEGADSAVASLHVGEVIRAAFLDPRGFMGSDKEIASQFRALRDEMTRWIDEFFGPFSDRYRQESTRSESPSF